MNFFFAHYNNKFKRYIDNFQISKYIEYYNKSIVYIKYLIKSFKELSDLHFASFSYIPFAGWILPLVMRRGNSFCEHHAKQGFFLSFVFVIAAITLNLINKFSPVTWRGFRLGIVMSVYVLYLSYLIFCFIAARIVLKGKPFDIIKRLADLIVNSIYTKSF